MICISAPAPSSLAAMGPAIRPMATPRSRTSAGSRRWSACERVAPPGCVDSEVMKLASYWHETAKAFDGGRQGPVDGQCDVAVIGGGFTGLSAALALAKKGATVTLVEAGRVGGEAS